MSDTSPSINALIQAAANEDWDQVEELWLEALDVKPIPVEPLLNVSRQLVAADKRTKARTLLELLCEALESEQSFAGTLAGLRELLALTPKPPPELLSRIISAVEASRSDSPSLAAVIARYPLQGCRRPLEQLTIIERWLDHDLGTIVEVIGQGVGRVVDVNLELENIKVDLSGPRPVSVPFGAVARYLRLLAVGNFRRRKVEDPQAMRELVHDSPAEALVQLLEGFDEPIDVATIKAALDGLLEPAAWSSWWAKARKHSRVVTSGTGSRLRYTVSHSAKSATDALRAELEEADPRARIALARRLASRGPEAGRSAAAFLAGSLSPLAEQDPGLAWETASVLATLPEGEAPARAEVTRLIAATEPGRLLAGIKDRAARVDALQALRQEHSETWSSHWAAWLPMEDSAANLTLIATTLEEVGASAALEEALEEVFRNPHHHPAQLIWACELLSQDEMPATLRRWETTSLLEILPDTLTRKEYASLRGRAKALFDGGQIAVRLILAHANQQQMTRFSQRISRLDVLEPERQRLIEQAVQQASSAPTEVEPIFAASRAAVEAKQAELKNLLEVEIPKTLKGINAAAAEGDLRENFEYHMLRDRQELQSARAAELKRDLATVRIIEPGQADTTRVNIGTVVQLTDLLGAALEPITILGPWDADVDKRVFAAATELAQELLNHQVGDQVTVADTKAIISGISAWEG